MAVSADSILTKKRRAEEARHMRSDALNRTLISAEQTIAELKTALWEARVVAVLALVVMGVVVSGVTV
jgi:hypothetical protein